MLLRIINTNEVEKIEKYQDLARELRKIWNMKMSIIPVIVGLWEQHQKIFAREWKTLELRPGYWSCRKPLSFILLGSSGKFLKFEESC